MTAATILPRLSLPDEARRKRLDAGWGDPEITRDGLKARGFTNAELVDARKRLGPKVTSGTMPRPGSMWPHRHSHKGLRR